jgi:hypothetical protein
VAGGCPKPSLTNGHYMTLTVCTQEREDSTPHHLV